MANLAFVAAKPDEPLPPLPPGVASALATYLRAVAAAREAQAQELRLPVDVFDPSPADYRAAAAVIDDVYWADPDGE